LREKYSTRSAEHHTTYPQSSYTLLPLGGGTLVGMHDIHIPAFTIRKEIIVGSIFFIAGALLFTAFSTIATTIGTNVSVTGHLFATSTVQATGNIVGYSNALFGGTTTPSALLSVANRAALSDQKFPLFTVASSTLTSTSTLFTVLNSGNVGIGTAGPRMKLDVISANTILSGGLGQIGAFTSDDMAIDLGGQIVLGGVDTTGGAPSRSFAAIAGRKENGTSGNRAGYLQLSARVGASGDLTEYMRITSTGNVGIGTTSPASLLSLSSSGTTTIHVGTTATTKGSCFQMYDAAHVAYRAFISKAGAWTVEAGTCE